MSNYFTCVKMLLKYKLKFDKGKKNGLRIGIIIALSVCYLMLAFTGVIAVYGLGSAFAQLELKAEFITVLLLMGMAFVLIFGVVSMLSYLYFSSDTEFFMALPIKSGTVYMAKLTIIYFIELFTSVLLLLPCLITAGVIFNLGMVYYITAVIAIILTPAIPLFLASILAIPLMYVVSFFKQRGALSSVALIILFGAAFAGYYAVITKFSSGMAGGNEQQIIEALTKNITAITTVFYPILALARFATFTPAMGLSVPVSMVINAAIYIGAIVALMVLAYLISAAVYKRGASSQLEGTTKTGNKAGTYAESSVLKALMKKEWREMVRTPAFAFQCLSGIVLAPIVIIFMKVMNGGGFVDLPTEVMEQTNQMMWFISMGIALMMGVSMNMGASTIMSREGNKAYYCKMLPVDYKTQVRAKTSVYLAVSSVTIIISMITLFFINMQFKHNALFTILGIVFMLIYNYGYVNFAAYFDLNKPKLDWNTPNEAMKHNINASIPVFINMGISAVFIIVPIIFSSVIYSLVATAIMWVVFYIIAFSVAIVMHHLLYKNADRLMEKIIK